MVQFHGCRELQIQLILLFYIFVRSPLCPTLFPTSLTLLHPDIATLSHLTVCRPYPSIHQQHTQAHRPRPHPSIHPQGTAHTSTPMRPRPHPSIYPQNTQFKHTDPDPLINPPIALSIQKHTDPGPLCLINPPTAHTPHKHTDPGPSIKPPRPTSRTSTALRAQPLPSNHLQQYSIHKQTDPSPTHQFTNSTHKLRRGGLSRRGEG